MLVDYWHAPYVSQELAEAEAEIARLTAELERLQAENAVLRSRFDREALVRSEWALALSGLADDSNPKVAVRDAARRLRQALTGDAGFFTAYMDFIEALYRSDAAQRATKKPRRVKPDNVVSPRQLKRRDKKRHQPG
jgi:hypothetical protein